MTKKKIWYGNAKLLATTTQQTKLHPPQKKTFLRGLAKTKLSKRNHFVKIQNFYSKLKLTIIFFGIKKLFGF